MRLHSVTFVKSCLYCNVILKVKVPLIIYIFFGVFKICQFSCLIFLNISFNSLRERSTPEQPCPEDINDAWLQQFSVLVLVVVKESTPLDVSSGICWLRRVSYRCVFWWKFGPISVYPFYWICRPSLLLQCHNFLTCRPLDCLYPSFFCSSHWSTL